jgi:hypothetical protein
MESPGQSRGSLAAERGNFEATASRFKAGQEDRLALLLGREDLISAEIFRLDLS